jgi:hypothetical protein
MHEVHWVEIEVSVEFRRFVAQVANRPGERFHQTEQPRICIATSKLASRKQHRSSITKARRRVLGKPESAQTNHRLIIIIKSSPSTSPHPGLGVVFIELSAHRIFTDMLSSYHRR